MIFGLGKMLRRRGLERRQLRIGYLPTLDAATLIIAQQQGFFADAGLDVHLSRQTSWARARQKLAERELDAAHLPGTAPLCAHLGMDDAPAPLNTAFVLALGGSSFGVSPAVFAAMKSSLPKKGKPTVMQALEALAAVALQRRESGEPALRFAVSDLYSNGSYDLRYSLAAAGIDPATDVQLVAVTPSRVQKSLHEQNYDGAWLDEPYGTLAQQQGDIHLLFSKQAVWNHSVGKVLAVPERIAVHQPDTHQALLQALLLAGAWLEENRAEAQTILATRHGLDMELPALDALVLGIDTLCGRDPHDLVFGGGAANFPWYSQAVWYLGQMIRWGDYAQVLDFKKTAQAVYLPATYRDAARKLSMPHPSIGYKNEGERAQNWVLDEASASLPMGPDAFFDGRYYKPRQTMKYLNGLEISHIKAPLDAMWAIR